jgi:hypothetical protein
MFLLTSQGERHVIWLDLRGKCKKNYGTKQGIELGHIPLTLQLAFAILPVTRPHIVRQHLVARLRNFL